MLDPNITYINKIKFFEKHSFIEHLNVGKIFEKNKNIFKNQFFVECGSQNPNPIWSASQVNIKCFYFVPIQSSSPQVLHCQSFPLLSLTYLYLPLFFGWYIICLNSMFNSGDELIINSYRIPWLIWIQLLVMFLLIILLYFFSLDLSVHSTASESAPSSVSASSSAGTVLLSATNTAAAGFLHDSQVCKSFFTLPLLLILSSVIDFTHLFISVAPAVCEEKSN